MPNKTELEFYELAQWVAIKIEEVWVPISGVILSDHKGNKTRHPFVFKYHKLKGII